MYRIFYKSGEKYLDTINPGDVLGWKVEERSFEIRAAVSTPCTCIDVFVEVVVLIETIFSFTRSKTHARADGTQSNR